MQLKLNLLSIFVTLSIVVIGTMASPNPLELEKRLPCCSGCCDTATDPTSHCCAICTPGKPLPYLIAVAAGLSHRIIWRKKRFSAIYRKLRSFEDSYNCILSNKNFWILYRMSLLLPTFFYSRLIRATKDGLPLRLGCPTADRLERS